MTIASNYEPEVKAADGAQLVFPFDFVWISNSVVIYQLTVEGARLLIDPQTYEITPGGTSPIFQGGTITFLAPEDAPSAPAIEVVRITDQTQLVDYTAYGPFPAEVTEFAFDKATMISQELQLNPVPPELSEFIPLSGTVDGRPVTGDIQFTTELEETGLLWDAAGVISTLRPEVLGILYCRSATGVGIVGGSDAAQILVGATGSVAVTTTAASGTTFNGPSVNINSVVKVNPSGGGELHEMSSASVLNGVLELYNNMTPVTPGSDYRDCISLYDNNGVGGAKRRGSHMSANQWTMGSPDADGVVRLGIWTDKGSLAIHQNDNNNLPRAALITQGILTLNGDTGVAIESSVGDINLDNPAGRTVLGDAVLNGTMDLQIQADFTPENYFTVRTEAQDVVTTIGSAAFGTFEIDCLLGGMTVTANANMLTVADAEIQTSGPLLTLASLIINAPNLPTSSGGLSAGDIWRDGNDLKIV
tara:strand:- start:10488 stop:11912 length:1425 start_codon:yes stop_codon:yes gene_type:complete